MDECAALSLIEVGERRRSRHCVYVNRATRIIGSVTQEEWREGKTIASAMHSLRDWLRLGKAR